MTSEEIVKGLASFRFRFNNEKELQFGIGEALEKMGASFAPEIRLSDKDRVDFLVEGGIGVEVKTNDFSGGASLNSVTRQLWRYAKNDQIKSLILVTTRSKHRDLPKEILGKPVYVVYLNAFL